MEQNLKLGDRLDLLVGNLKCPSRLEEITPEGTLVVSEPSYRSPIVRGDSLTLMYYRRSGMYSCTVVVTRKLLDKERILPLLEIEIRSHVTKHQRREYVRFEVSIPAAVVLLAGTNDAHQADATLLLMGMDNALRKARAENAGQPEPLITDISGGGLRVSVPHKIAAGSLIGCEFVLGENELVRACCLVMNEEFHESELPYRLGCRYASIEERAHRRVIRYIFDEQVRRLR